MGLVYDTFLFYNELDLLEIRLNILWDVVDFFVVAESTLTHQGKSKPLYFKNNKFKFDKYKDKIIHLVIDDKFEMYRGVQPWRYQRDCIGRALINCKPDDRIILSDIDEIPSPDKVLLAKSIDQTVLFQQKLYYYFVDCESVELNALPWSVMFSYSEMPTLQKMRDFVTGVQAFILGGDVTGGRDDYISLSDAGWHFSYLGGVTAIIDKIEAFADCEFNLPEFKNPQRILRSIRNGLDIYGRSLNFKFLDNYAALPAFLVKNAEKYPRFFSANCESEV